MFPSPPLKFRTTGFPQYGFKWDVKHDLRHRTTYTCPKPRSLALWLLRACRRAAVQWPSHPEALRSAAGYAVPPPQPVLWPHLRLSEPPADLCLRRRVFACRPAPRGSPLYSTCVCRRAAFRTPVDRVGALGCCFPTRTSFRRLCNGSASTSPRRQFSRGRVSRLQSSLHAAARRLARPSLTRTFTLELSPPESPPKDVEYDYAGSQPIPAAGLAPATHAALWAASRGRGGRREKRRKREGR